MNRKRRYAHKPKGKKGGFRPGRRILKIRPGADAGLKRVFAGIGVPAKRPFKPDPFQLEPYRQSNDPTAWLPPPPVPGRPGLRSRPLPEFTKKAEDHGMLPP